MIEQRSQTTSRSKSSIWLGTAGWSYLPDWAGSFYPLGTTTSQTLERYVEAFRFVEVDSTFYAAPALPTIDRWARIFPKDFRASFKAPRELVQDTMLVVPEIPFGHFCGSLADRLQDRLAMVVVQMQPSFLRTPENERAFRSFIERWATEYPLGVEFRSVSWRRQIVLDFLREHSVSMVSNDLHDVPDLDRGAFDTSDKYAYIRLIGRHDGLDKDRIQRPQTDARAWWVQKIAAMAERGVRHIYVVANNHYEGHAPATLRTLVDELGAAGIEVVPFTGWPDGQTKLF
jgi:uncharacterized protein YecE (DUF72 family)